MTRTSELQEAFQILQLKITTDKKAIRQAYSNLAKLHHPEEDPKGWELLRCAYEKAIAYAGQNSVRIEDAPLGTETESRTETESQHSNGEEHEYQEVADFFQSKNSEREAAYDSMEELVLTRLRNMQDTQSVLANEWYRVYEMPEMDQVRTSYAVLLEIYCRLRAELPPETVCRFLQAQIGETARQIRQISDQEAQKRLILLVWAISACLRGNVSARKTGTDDAVKARRTDLILYLVIACILVFGFFGYMIAKSL